MDLATTFRGLNRMETGTATRALERSTNRFERLLDGPTTLRVVVEGGPPEYRVMMSMGFRGADVNADDSGHDLGAVIASVTERVRSQIVRIRHRRESQRHREVAGGA